MGMGRKGSDKKWNGLYNKIIPALVNTGIEMKKTQLRQGVIVSNYILEEDFLKLLDIVYKFISAEAVS